MHIAIIGAGFCGLAIAWHLLHEELASLQVTVFDAQKIGAGASGIAVGLLHPYAGAHAKLNREGKEGMEATLQLLKDASEHLGRSVFMETGLLRLALSDQQKLDFRQCAQKYAQDVLWLEAEECQEKFPHLTATPGIWIKPGITVYSKLYLQGLWQACARKGAKIEQRTLHTLDELSHFDHIILAAGAQSRCFPECASHPLSTVKGQLLELAWPPGLPPLPFPLNSRSYLVMGETGGTCLAGGTFERAYSHIGPDVTAAAEKIIPQVITMLPALSSAPIVSCHAGLRAVTPDHFPLIGKIGKNQWIITGMGSKGLLYHALLAKRLVHIIKIS